MGPGGNEAADLDIVAETAASGAGCGRDAGPITINQHGEHVLEVFFSADGSHSASYTFVVLDVPPPDVFDIALGEAVGRDLPAPGAGALEVPASRDHYRIDLQAGQRIQIRLADGCETSGSEILRAELLDPAGTVTAEIRPLNDGHGDCADDPGPITVNRSGLHTIDVHYGENTDATAAVYGFTVTEASAEG